MYLKMQYIFSMGELNHESKSEELRCGASFEVYVRVYLAGGSNQHVSIVVAVDSVDFHVPFYALLSDSNWWCHQNKKASRRVDNTVRKLDLTMDWDYILTISPEDLTEEEKDDLYNTVTWLNCDEENLNLEKALALVKVSQEILKYKGEQVEILLHKLDELATQQGEEAVRKVDSDDARSSKSRKSSSIEIENLEQKYSELKIKYKKQVKTNEKNSAEIARMTKKIVSLEQERKRLLSEIQMSQDDSRSDVSESVKEQHKELAVTIHNKNQQISDLLRDIEEIENDNMVLREKLTNVRDELSSATKELTVLTESLKSSKLQLEEAAETIDRLTVENENLRDEAQEAFDQKQNFEKEMEEFTEEVNSRVDEWKRILDEKEKEIDELKSRKQSSIHSSLSSLPREHDTSQTHVSALHKLLSEREKQLLDVKVKLQEAVKEMDEATKVIRELTQEKEEKSRKVEDLSELLRELKKQLKASHERSQDLQDGLAHAEKTIQNQDRDLKEILAKLRSDDEHDLADNLEQIQELKGQNRMQEKQIVNLVKVSNKLQDMCDRLERENAYLREKAGMSEDDVIDAEVATKQKQQRREVALLKKKVEALEEIRLQLKLENHTLNKTIHQLSTDTGKQDVLSELSKYEIVQLSKDETDDDGFYKDQSKALVEENEALRRGLHEIMDSLNSRKESSLKELKSETFEKLLRALDAKHISGWYHPAMRFQAEMHNLEGINAELREQLRLARIEVQSQKSMPDIDLDSISETPDLNMMNNIRNNLKSLMMKLEAESENTSEIASSMETYKESFVQIRIQISLLYEEYMKSKRNFQDELSKYEEKLRELEESDEIKLEKLQFLNLDNDSVKVKSLELVEENVKLKRKCDFLQEQTEKLSDRVSSLQKDLSQAEVACLKTINELTKKNQTLSVNLEIVKSKSDRAIEPEFYEKLRKDLETSTIKYREALRNFEQVGKDTEFEMKLLEEGNQLLVQEKAELMSKLGEVLEKLHRCENSTGEVHESVAGLTKKLSEYEVNALGEKQRANHTNNLYELVKEQLQKSEERLAQFEKYNKEVLQKNLLLQEQLRDMEKKVCDSVDHGSYKALQNQYNEALRETENLKATSTDLNEQLAILKSSKKIESLGNREQELLSLKHLIVDLQAESDDKMQISRLSSDLAHSKFKLGEFEEKIQKLEANLKNAIEEREHVRLEFQKRGAEWSEKEVELIKKLSILRELLANHKLQYLGCAPLCSEEKYVDNIRKAISDKHRAFLQLHSAQVASNDAHTAKEQYENELKNLEKVLKLNGGEFESILVGYQERKLLQFNEVKLKRQLELKEAQIRHVFERVKVQDDQLIKLEEELFALHNHYFDFDLMNSPSPPPAVSRVEVPKTPPKDTERLVKESSQADEIKLTRTKETQTLFEIAQDTESTVFDKTVGNLRIELLNVSSELEEKNQLVQELKSKITEHEMSISLFRKQLGDRQSQITFYEKHILELQSKVSSVLSTSGGVEKGDEIVAMKSSLKTFQDTLKQKEEEVLHYQSLLKDDRDKHSLAAALMREELKVLQKCLAEEKQKCADLRGSINETHPSKAALEQYFVQVHALEDELSQLRTMVSSLDSQLRASRQEAVRWRTLANDRLESMQKLGKDLEELHQNEIQVYKNESEKWFEEVSILKIALSKCRGEMWHESDYQKLIKEKDDRIHELTVMMRQARNEAKRNVDRPDNESFTRLTEVEVAREQLLKEHDALKKRFDQLLNRERSAREEIRELKAKLLRKPILSARSDKSERSIKEQLQKKVTALENEIVELKEKLAHQVAVNETHRVQISQDFDRWNKQKHFQQTIEKLKSKLKAKEQDFEKLQETCAGYRILIERMEREKYGLENKVRSLKSLSGSQLDATEIEILRSENSKLILENENLLSKLEMQRQHSGGLGAAMLQEKLEAQERKIAVLELSSRGSTVEVRAELERLQNTVSGLQKANLCLEAENLELKLDLEKYSKEVPHLREQIQHLENYTEVLKTESRGQGDEVPTNPRAESKKVSELERTIFVLKRVVEKLQAENRRLSSGVKRPYSNLPASAEKLQRDHQRLKLQYDECLQKVSKLEQELSLVTSGSVESSLRWQQQQQQNKPVCGGGGDNVVVLSDELREVKEQLEQKSHLLNKVKVLLHRAAVKEKALLQEMAELKGQHQEHREKSDENSA